jgi:hypothetical protein
MIEMVYMQVPNVGGVCSSDGEYLGNPGKGGKTDWSEWRSFIEAKEESKRHLTSDTRQVTKELRKAVEAK